ncbi:MAG: hypothetical protein JO324_03185 [Candidatus Eremiobacteraeota bacterium]|nr:hypothetical protein [Candidatus Eremiobacteraeota bacterium]
MNRATFAASSVAAAAAVMVPRSIAANAGEPSFRFRSGFWQNLHHTLYYQAQVLETVYGSGSKRLAPIDQAAFTDLQQITASDQESWYRALRTYRDRYASLSFVFDDTLMNADNEISGDEATPLSMTLPAAMLGALETAAPAYRKSLWERHDASNRAFIASLGKLVAANGCFLSRQLRSIYKTPWLAQPYVVDVVPYAQWEGSYSNNAAGFVHIVMSVQDPSESGMGGLDVLFHEASHSIADPDKGTIGAAIVAEAARLNRPAPDQFWHAVIMYTPGKLVEELAARSGMQYTMVWMQPGLLGRAWSRYYQALETHWLPYMRGTGTLEAAIARCVDDITATPPTRPKR